MLRFFIVLTSLMLSFQMNAESNCDFKTSEFLNELKNPKNINFINIKIPKSGKYMRNSFKILTSKGDVIPSDLKKKFKANLTVNYNFGECKYLAKIRQSGDRKDHIKFLNGGKLLQSLDVKLDKGNILRATHFKLLIPETRNGKNEILASLILKNSGFIAPETFEVSTLINGTKSIMIFQENAKKELLERNFKREGAIFEGDETLLWSFKKYDKFFLEPLALSRLVNGNWFLKGPSSQIISLSAYSKVQSMYLTYAATLQDQPQGTWGVKLEPNKESLDNFVKFDLMLLAMNGSHGLRPHNRKFYYNSITSEFIPIYYDGDVDFIDLKNNHMGHQSRDIIQNLLSRSFNFNWSSQINEIVDFKDLKIEFIKRVNIPENDAAEFFNLAIKVYKSNLVKIEELITSSSRVKDKKKIKNKINSYTEFQKENQVSQLLVSDVKIDNEKFVLDYFNGNSKVIDEKEMKDIISNNLHGKERVTLIQSKSLEIDTNFFSREISEFSGKIAASPGIKISIDKSNKSISFTQSQSKDWVLIDSADLNNWKIRFIGLEKNDNEKFFSKQRFNQFGLTGCLTIYRSTFKNVSFEINNGECEDSLNILNSKGNIDSIYIKNAFADALDVDFSEINASIIDISYALNDCFDLSDGKYNFESVKLNECGDKGLSVGEQSTLNLEKILIYNSNIGIASKDSSETVIDRATVENVEFCLAAYNKKQEFFGSLIKIKNIECKNYFKRSKLDNFSKIEEINSNYNNENIFEKNNYQIQSEKNLVKFIRYDEKLEAEKVINTSINHYYKYGIIPF
ncbi:hypothetical protein [Candidatus Pelagibacter sp. HIMB1321]|uniref:hypothetical protein n=1 Tax=Candidatus Pelagibacter sp. HIMB1321 TaxID=1388755 RepID=UPI000A081C49|nr:hypothetical protein [Candidatus Pelagibacter sp. HIMB1321]SMF79498.1 hypothetical protein SAMN02744631_1041 [Candidatus Pelagibacter sp. HIMB1321]